VSTIVAGDPLALLVSAVELVGFLRQRAEAEGVPAAVAAVVATLSCAHAVARARELRLV